jgi:hypothetical protein
MMGRGGSLHNNISEKKKQNILLYQPSNAVQELIMLVRVLSYA